MTILQRASIAERAHDAQGRAKTFAQYAACVAMTRGNKANAAAMFASRHPHSIHKELITKAAVAAGTTTDATWANPIADYRLLGDAFLELLRPQSIVAQIAQDFVRVPFNVKIPRQTSGSAVLWVGQGRPTQVSPLAFDNFTFSWAKIAGLVVITKELASLSDPDATNIITADLGAVIAKFTDDAFFAPEFTAVTDISPASVTSGATNVPSTGITAAQIEADLGNLLAAITTDRRAVFLIMRRSTALAISRLRNATSGAVTFPDMGAYGGTIWGVPVIVSDNLPDDANSPQENIVVGIDAAEILYADGGLELDSSENATLQMDSAPAHPPAATSVMVSLWQQDLVGIKTTRFVNWARRRTGAVAYISGCAY